MCCYQHYEKSDLVIGGLLDVNRKWRHISVLPGSSEQVHEVVVEVPYTRHRLEHVLER